MPTSHSFVLLDTMVVGGIFAVSKSDSPKENENKNSWKSAIANLINRASITNTQFIVPTSVCYELISMDKNWFNFVLNSSSGGIFQYSKNNIASKILQLAAQYSYSSRIEFSEKESYKSKSFDPITAAYSLFCNYPLITENQDDFCEPYFKIVAIEPVLLNAKQGKYRRLLSLLRPQNNL